MPFDLFDPRPPGSALGRRPTGLAIALGAVVFTSILFASSAWLAEPARAEFGDSNWWNNVNRFGGSTGGPKQRKKSSRRDVQIDDLRPNTVPFRSEEMLDALEVAIARYEKIAANGGWPVVPGPRMMRPGDSDNRVPALRKRLRASGDLEPYAGTFSYEGYEYDNALEAAVRRFQKRHGLRVRGRVDRSTFAALNVPAHKRLHQLRLNFRRISELLSNPIEERYVLVNIPAFQLEAVERYEVASRHRVIVGRVDRETPSIKATIKGLNFLPYWRVPESIARKDLVPRMQKEPDYLEKEHIRAVRGHFDGPEVQIASIDWTQVDTEVLKFRQDPGPWNALGLVRINMPNEHIVYMHDTPMKQLFRQRARAFSAGCVRVQNVMELVEWLARYEPGWDQPGRVQQVLDVGEQLDVEFSRPVPVYFTYITAWMEPGRGNAVQFRPDIYSRDGGREFVGEQDLDDPPPEPRQVLAP